MRKILFIIFFESQFLSVEEGGLRFLMIVFIFLIVNIMIDRRLVDFWLSHWTDVSFRLESSLNLLIVPLNFVVLFSFKAGVFSFIMEQIPLSVFNV